MAQTPPVPRNIDLKRNEALTITWTDDTVSRYPIDYLRRMSPSADQRELRREMAENPLTVLPSGNDDGPLTATGIDRVGRYAVRITFSDGHDTGIYSWEYLREIDPGPSSAP